MAIFNRKSKNIFKSMINTSELSRKILEEEEDSLDFTSLLTHKSENFLEKSEFFMKENIFYEDFCKYKTDEKEIFMKNLERFYEQLPRTFLYFLHDHHKKYEPRKCKEKDFIVDLILKHLENDNLAVKKLMFLYDEFKIPNNLENKKNQNDLNLLREILEEIILVFEYKTKLCILLFPCYESTKSSEKIVPIFDNFEKENNPILEKSSKSILNFNDLEKELFKNYFENSEENNISIKYDYSNAPFPIPLFSLPGVYCDGVYDLFHFGHARQLMQAKMLFPSVRLIVGVTSNEDTKYHKGISVMNAQERAESARHCKYVDEVVANCIWVLTEDFMEKYDIWFAVHDDEPYAIKPKGPVIPILKESADVNPTDDLYAFLKDSMRFIISHRTPGISTSALIKKLLYNYENFLERNINRGMTAKDLNISPIKFNFIKFKNKLNDKFAEIKQDFKKMKSEFLCAFHEWEEDTRTFFRVRAVRNAHNILNGEESGSEERQ